MSKLLELKLQLQALEDRCVPATFTVTNINDLGAGSLRQAIIDANAQPGADAIDFNIGGGGQQTIVLTSAALPTITEAVHVNGFTQPGYAGTPLIELRGDSVVTGNPISSKTGITIAASNVTVIGLAINRFANEGVWINSGTNNTIQNNYVGTDVTGTLDKGNSGDGIFTNAGANANLIVGNLVSGNDATGILLQSDSNKVQGNRVGTKADGNSALGNSLRGVWMYVGSSNVIGVDGDGIGDATEGNLISGNSGPGIYFQGDSNNNVIAGNLIGTNAAGTAAVANVAGGISFLSDFLADNNRIGTNADGTSDKLERNVISGNANYGIVDFGKATLIAGNYVGTKADGLSALANAQGGVSLGSTKAIVGGTAAASRNVISGNAGFGVSISTAAGTKNTILGNYIGTDAAGTAAVANTSNGVQIDGGATNNTIGGTTAAERNIVSGNSGDGVQITGVGTSGNTVAGNYIGLDVTGDAPLANAGFGVAVRFGATGNTIGGTKTLGKNVISGNGPAAGAAGVGILDSGTTGNFVSGNYIGTDATGTKARGGNQYGVILAFDAAANFVGTNGDGTNDSDEGNLISGNTNGVWVQSNADNNVIAGNYIGTKLDGVGALGNTQSGIRIFDSSVNGTRIGTNADGKSDAFERNVISANASFGVYESGGGGTIVAGNYVGTDFKGAIGLGVQLIGVVLQGATNATIGTNADGVNDAAERNVITGNIVAGVQLTAATATGNKVAGNYIGTAANGTSLVAGGQNGTGVLVDTGANSNTIGGANVTAVQSFPITIGSGTFILSFGPSVTAVLPFNATTLQVQTALNALTSIGGVGGSVTVTKLANVYTVTFGGTLQYSILPSLVLTENGIAGTVNILSQGLFAGNVVSGNSIYGIQISGVGTSNNKVTGNDIGTNAAGAAGLGNTYGIWIENGAGAETIGGPTPGERNIIAGNSATNVYLRNSSGNRVQGNYIGYSPVGSLGTQFSGVFLDNGSSNNFIGTDGDGINDATEGNVISGHDAASGIGVYLSFSSNNNVIAGNLIGTTPDGFTAKGNTQAGIYIVASANGNRIGTDANGQSDALERNVIAGNGVGIIVRGVTGTVIAGNFIGTDGTGAAALGNLSSGILIDAGATNNTIGGTTAAARNVVSGNLTEGVQISGAGTTGNRVYGNYIGTDAAGTGKLANNDGVFLTGNATGNFIGTDGNGVTDSGEGNVISGNTSAGVLIISADGNRIAGNLIGLNAAGTGAVPNFDGVFLQSTGGNIIGTDGSVDAFNANERNYISGNSDRGVVLDGANVVAGNWIGLKPDGKSAGTQQFGVQVTGLGSRVGTNADGIADTDERNVISGNSNTGIIMSSTSAIIAGNYIGTDATGAFARPNANGVSVVGTLNTIGGAVVGAGNVISGNTSTGVLIAGVGTSNNVVLGNFIGTNFTGNGAVPNVTGVSIQDGSTNNTIGGTTAGARNVISGNSDYGMLVSGTGTNANAVYGNFIGTNTSGKAALSNGTNALNQGNSVYSAAGVSIRLGVTNTKIGGTTVGQGNVISGNAWIGVSIGGAGTDGTTIQGNIIGLTANGNAALGNDRSGVLIGDGAANALIGGTAVGARNVLSGNAFGVALAFAAGTGNRIEGNFIGTDTAGTAAFGNGTGVLIFGGTSGTTIGGTTATARNIISGNTDENVRIDGATTSGNVISANYIGLNAAGLAGLPGGANNFGVVVFNAPNNTIGGATVGERNVISGNARSGIDILGLGAVGNKVYGNFIGTNPAGSAKISNLGQGVVLDLGANGNFIGGSTTTPGTGLGNLISGNLGQGVLIQSNSTGNKVQGNNIGLNAAGDTAIGNGLFNAGSGPGLQILLGSNNTLVGGPSDITAVAGGTRNVIAGNPNGDIAIGNGANASTGVVIQGNYVGTDITGTSLIAGGNTGIVVGSATGLQIGGSGVNEGNLIAGAFVGIQVFAVGSDGTTIQGNRIGTDKTGTQDIGATTFGIRVSSSAKNTLIGGTTGGAMNLISGNTVGIRIDSNAGGSPTNVLIQGNRIGTKLDGLSALANGTGIEITDSASGVTVGGTAAGARNIISGNTGDGVNITGVGTTNNNIAGNTIGLAADGTTALGNISSGVRIDGSASGNTIGGGAAGAGNVISANVVGVTLVTGSTNNLVAGNRIGTDATGTLARGNASFGVHIFGSANTIGSNGDGSNDAGEGNLISGNQYGIFIQSGGNNTVIAGNFIGTNATGTAALGNTVTGVYIFDSNVTGTRIGTNADGTSDSLERNVIAGNANGVFTFGQQTIVAGNYLGTNAAGTVALAGGNIAILTGATQTRIGTNADGVNDASERNVISGNAGYGVQISGLGTSNNTVAGNYIGTTADGTAALGNTGVGVNIISGARNNTIGGLTAIPGTGAGNVISGNIDGVSISGTGSDSNRVQGNIIGTNASGTASLGNLYGVVIQAAASNTVGGGAAGAGNLISGNTGVGVYLEDAGTSGNKVQGNWIGTNLAGSAALANFYGIQVRLVDGANLIGSDADGTNDASERNIISGNTSLGILVGDSTNQTIAGNYIGTNVAGTLAIANGFIGVLIANSTNTTIGGLVAAARNVISGNAGRGLLVQGSASAGTVIHGNYIGTNVAGTAALGNSVGVQLQLGATGVTVGGASVGARNIISGNTLDGVRIEGSGTTGNTVLGNYIGTNATGTAALGNSGDGVSITSGASGNIIGGKLLDTNLNLGNLVAFNGKGIYLDATVSGNTIRFNRVYSNGGLTSIINDSNNPNTPALTAALGGNSAEIFGGFQGVAGKSYLVDFYVTDVSGTAKIYLGNTTYLANGVGFVSIDSLFPGTMPFGAIITATATRVDTGSTSGLAVGTPAVGAIIRGLPFDLKSVEGKPLTLTAFTVQDTTGLSYRWSILKDGVPYADSVGSFTPVEAGMTFIPDNNATYIVQVTITTGIGGTSTAGPASIVVSNAPPRPELRLTTDQVQAGSVVVAQAVGNDPGTADVVTFVWQVWFGPAIGLPLSSGTGDNFSFTPTLNGFYRLRLTADDHDGGVAVVERLVESRGASPLASITLITSGNEGDPVQARADVSQIVNGEDLVFEWKVTKNGVAYTPITTPTAGAVQFVPNDQGSYRIDLRVRSLTSGLTTDAAPVFVTPGNTAPVVSIVAPTLPVLAGAPITFISKAAYPGSADTLSYQWTATILGSTVQYGGISQNFTFTPGIVGQYQVSLTVTDNSSASATASQFFVVTAGTITLGINGFPTAPVAEGTALNLSAAVTAGSYRYDWTVTRDGMPYLTASSRTLANPNGFVAVPLDFPLKPNDNGKYEVTLQVTLPTGKTGIRTQSFKAFNVPPLPTITVSAGPYIEGVPILFTAAPHDPGTADTHSYAWKINGVSYGADPANPSVFKFVPPDNGSYTASVTVTDDEGLPASVSTAPLTVLNANPTLSIRSGAPVAGKVSLALDWRDVPADTKTVAATWKLFADNVQVDSGSEYTLSYTPVIGKRYTIEWTAGDEDNGSSTIRIASLVGTAGDDTRVITAADVAGVDAVIYQGLAGNDTISVAPGITTPMILDGGDGDDVIAGGDGDNVLIAGTGKNTLTGGKGNNLFIGGGSDTMFGGSGTNRYMVHFSEVQIVAGAGSIDTVDFSGITTSGVAVRFDGNPAYQFPFAGNTTSKLSLVGSFEGVVGTNLGDKISINTSNITVFGGAGDDNVTVDGGSNVSFDGGKGSDNVTVTGGDMVRVFGGESGDTNVTIGGTATNVDVIGGNQQFLPSLPGGLMNVSITGGNLIRVFGGEDSENVTVGGTAKDVTISTGGGVNGVLITGGELIRVFGGEDSENVTVGGTAKDVIISTGGGVNGVLITGGELIRVFGGEGDENVTVGVGAKDVIISTGGGVNNVSISGGELIRVFGDVGVDNVTVNGASNNVLISTGGGKDAVSIGGGNLVTVFTGDADDSVTISGGTNLLLAAGEGNDKILVTGGTNLILLGDGGNDLVTISGGDHISVYGGEGDDAATVTGTATEVLVSGWNGKDKVSVAGGTLITAVGGIGEDNFTITGGSKILIGGGLDNDNFSITGGDLVTAFGGEGDDNVAVGGGTNVIVVGDQGDDHFTVTGGDLITVFGGLNNDDVLVNTVTGRVEVLGSEGNDKIQVLQGTQISADGGSGDDAITVSGGDQVTVFGGSGNDAVSVSGGLFIKVLGGSGNDSVTVSGGTNLTVNGGSGNDVITANNPAASNIVLFGDSGNDIITADQPVGITVSGGRGDDYLLLGRGVDVVAYGDDGNDNYIFLNTGSGNVKLKELINLDSSNLDQPSRGDDFVDFSAFTTAATFNLGLIGSELDPTIGKQIVNGVTIWLFGSFEGIYGTSASDLLIGNENDNQIYGLGGNDTIYGLGGNDTLVGGLGDDSLIGGTGNDWYAFYGTSVESDVVVEAANLDVDTLDFSGRGLAVTVDLSSTAVQTYDGSSKIQLSSSTGLENIVGSNFADTLTGNSRDNQIAGLGGNDTLTGAAGDDVYYFAGSNAGTDRVVETAADAGSDTLDFSGFLAPIQLDLAVTSAQSFGTFGGVQLSDGMGVENIVGTGYADRLFGNARPNAIHGAGGADYIDGRSGNDNLYGGLTQVVFLDFATGTELPRGDFDYLNTASATVGVSAADAIIARLNTIFTGLDYRFTMNLADAQAWTANSGREFVTLVFNDGPGGGIGGESNEIDFRNLIRDGRGTINVNDLLGGTTQPPKTVANFIALSSTIAAHELGHMAGLRHGDAFGPIGSGLYEHVGAAYLAQITPTYTGLFNAVYTPLHILASPLSVGTKLSDATQNTYFGERELIKLSFADTGTAIREASPVAGSHGTFSTATAFGVLPALNVFNTIGAREAGYVPAAGQNFDWMNVSALSVSGNLDAVAGLAEKDVYSFYGTAGDIINIELISSSIRPSLSNPIDGVLRVYDANGNLLYESDNEFETADANVFDLRLPTSGLFYIEVTSKTPTDTGRYELFVTRFGPRTPNLQPLGLGDTIVGGAGSDYMYGTTANDTFRVGAIAAGDVDTIDGGLGDDLFDKVGFAGVNAILTSIELTLSTFTVPTLAPIAAMTVNEGQTLTFTAAGSTTATGDRLAYSLAPAATGLFPNGASIDPNTGKFTFIPTNQGAFSVKVIVTNADGQVAERTFAITANNVAPTLALTGLATLFEAGTWTGGGTVTDPGLDTLTVTVNYGDGSGWLPVVLGTNHKYQLSHVYGDNGNYTVTVRVNDGDGGSDEKTLPVVVLNVAPTATLSNAGDVTEGTVGVAAVNFTTATDVSAVDATSLRFAYDFNNDGIWDLGTGTYAGSVTNASPVLPAVYVNDGLLTRTVKARVIDKDGGFTDYLTSFTVFNAPPTATINGPLVVTINEGSVLNLTGTGSDVGQDTLTYLWTALGAFDKTPHTSTTTGLSYTVTDDDQYTVTFTVTDSDGASVTKTVQVNVLNVAPTLTVGSVATVQPGVPFSRTVTFTDPGADTWTAEVNYGDGGGWQPIAINATKQIALSHTYATAGNFTLQVRVTDDNGGTDTKSFPVVSNLPPVASVVGPANGVRGQVRTFTLSATDYIGDVAAGFEYRVNWGDGSPVQVVTRTANNINTPLTHTYMTLGNFTVSVLAVDQYGAISPAATTVIPILVAALQTSGGITTLAVGGSDASDEIQLELKDGHPDTIVVEINDVKQEFRLVQKIEVYGNGGNDEISIDEDITLPAMIDGGAGNDTIEGGGGNNTIYGGLGNDVIEGGDGNDVIYGGDGNDTIDGGAGNDVIDAGSGNNSVDGGAGNDTITAGSGNDTIDGGDGNDVINAGDGNNSVKGGDGNDTITAGSGNDTIDGGSGNDLINAGDGNNYINGGDGNDTITAGSGNDTIYGGDGNDVINAGDGNNWVDGGSGNDTITAGSGSDTLYGGDGDDLIRAGAGNDTLDGGAGNDILIGGDGDDLLVGGDGRDLLIGGFGADRINGNAQDDILIAGYTSFDNNDVALNNIMAEWTSSGSYTSRVNNLTTGFGAAGGVKLIGDDGATQTVFNDNDVDTLIGSSGQDWFFANTINDNGGAIDIVVDAAGNEIVRDTDY